MTVANRVHPKNEMEGSIESGLLSGGGEIFNQCLVLRYFEFEATRRRMGMATAFGRKRW